MSTSHNRIEAENRRDATTHARPVAPSRRSSALRAVALSSLVLASALALQAQGPGGPGGAPGGMRPGGPGGPGSPGMSRTPPPAGPNNNSSNSPIGLAPNGARLQGPAGRWWDESRYSGAVGLTTDQQRRMDTIFQQNRSALVSGLDNLRKAQSRLDTLSAGDHPNEAAVLTEIQNVAQARADLAKTSAHMQLQIRNEMTNDQLNKLDKLK